MSRTIRKYFLFAIKHNNKIQMEKTNRWNKIYKLVEVTPLFMLYKLQENHNFYFKKL